MFSLWRKLGGLTRPQLTKLKGDSINACFLPIMRWLHDQAWAVVLAAKRSILFCQPRSAVIAPAYNRWEDESSAVCIFDMDDV